MDVVETPIFSWVLRLFVSSVLMTIVVTSSFARIGYDITTDTLVSAPAAIPDTTAGTGAVFTEVEVMPDFSYKSMHGAEAFSNYIVDSFIFPSGLGEISFQARYSVSFVVEVDGHISTINLVRRLDPTTDKEIVRVISNAPRWIPGEHKGKKVRVAYSISVLIKI